MKNTTKYIHIQYHKTKVGEFIQGSFDEKLCMLDWRYRKMRNSLDKRIQKGLNAKFVEKDNEILKETRRQIDEYLSGKRKLFKIPTLLVGSDFQKQVWQELLKVSYGETASYLDLAKRIGNEKAVRATASANGANAISLIIPCHRIIESSGGLGGYAGGLSVKKRLLKIEGENIVLSDDEKYNFFGKKDTKYNHKFIIAVKTTGIFCLPSCSARKPNRENVIFYDTKKEATKNNFRACKICKP